MPVSIVTTADAAPFFVYHHANAYENDNELVIDLIAYPDEQAVTGLTMANLRSKQPDFPQGDLVRYRVPLDGGRAKRQLIREGPIEFPMIHYQRYNGRAPLPHRLPYGFHGQFYDRDNPSRSIA